MSPTQFSVPFGGDSRLDVNVTTASGCAWTAVSDAPWITVTQGGSGSGNGTVRLSVAANALPEARTGTVRVAEVIVTVTQAGLLNEELTLSGTIADLGGRCPDRTFTLSGERIVTNGQTDYPGRNECRDLRDGRSARVRGRRQADGSILADRIDRIEDGDDDLTFISRLPQEDEE